MAGRPIVLDAGGLIALERGDRRIKSFVRAAESVHVPAGALAQVWRNPQGQVEVGRVVSADNAHIHQLDEHDARAIGRMLAASRTADVIDASVVLVTRLVDGVAATSDPDDLRAIDPHLRLVAC